MLEKTKIIKNKGRQYFQNSAKPFFEGKANGKQY